MTALLLRPGRRETIGGMSEIPSPPSAGSRPGRLGVGIISAGRVGAVLGSALRAVDHRIIGVHAVSEASRERAELLLPGVPVLRIDEIVERAELVLLAVPKDRRAGLPNSHYLIHQPMSGMKGVATDIEIHAKELAKTHAKLNRIIAEETGTSEEQVAKDTDRDHWLDADEAKQYGLISRVVKTRAEIVKGDSGAK